MRVLEMMWRDVRHAGRSLRLNLGFTMAAIGTLAVCIGATTAVFSVVNAALLRPLPYDRSEDLVVLWQEYTSRGWGVVPVSHPNFLSIARQTRSFSGLAGLQFQTAALTGVAEPEMLAGVSVTPGAFQVLGVDAALGRTLTEADARPGAERAVVLSHSLWRNRFGADPELIGRSISLNHEPATVIGVMPRDFEFPPRFRMALGGEPFTVPSADLWMSPALDSRPSMAGTRNLFVVGRLAPGATLERARSDAEAIAPRLLEEYPGPANVGLTLVLEPLKEQVAGETRRPLLLLLGSVGLVVLIGCANVASMLLARGIARQAELALRAALGASRGQLIRHALVESVLLACAAGAIGLLLALWITAALSASIGSLIPQLHEIPIDGRVLGFTAAITVIVGMIFGGVPAVRTSCMALRQRLSRSSTGSVGLSPVSRSHGRVLLICETALSLLLLVGAGLLVRSFYALVYVDPGFDPSRATAIGFELPSARYPTAEQRMLFHQQLVSRVGALPGVEAVGVTSRMPFTGGVGTGGLNLEGRQAFTPDERPHAAQRIVDSEYFDAMGIEVVRGRGFRVTDAPGALQVAIVNETAARRFWLDADPIGQRVQPDGVDDWLTVVGVVEDVRHTSLATAAQPEVYWPFAQRPTLASADATSLPIGVVIRSGQPAVTMASAVRRTVRAIDPDLPATIVSTFEELMAESIAESRLYAMVMTLFAGFGLLVAASGLYGVLSFVVAQRRHEMGVRLALGARPRQVTLMVLRDGIAPVLAGTVIGMWVAVAGGGVIASELYDVRPTDSLTLIAVPVLLLSVALCACYVPARRAARIDPVVTLRE